MKLLSSLSYSLLIYYKTHALFLGVRFFVKCVIINFKEVKYMRILIVEDEKDLSMILTEMLEMEGYYVDAAYDGVSGLVNALSGIYDIINSEKRIDYERKFNQIAGRTKNITYNT